MTFTEYFLGIENWSQSVFLTSPGECFLFHQVVLLRFFTNGEMEETWRG